MVEAVKILRVFSLAALAFAAVLLVAPAVQVLRGRQTVRAVAGLWISGVGFVLIGLGLAMLDRGLEGAVLLGVAVAGAGQLRQARAAKDP